MTLQRRHLIKAGAAIGLLELVGGLTGGLLGGLGSAFAAGKVTPDDASPLPEARSTPVSSRSSRQSRRSFSHSQSWTSKATKAQPAASG